MPTLYSPAGLVRTARRLAAGAALSWLAAGGVHAQVMPLYGFTNTTSPYTALSGGTPIDPIAGAGTVDDGYSRPQTIPFSFPFGFNSYTSYVVTNNGWITFGAGNTTYQVPLNQSNNQMIAFFAKDLRSDGTSTAYSSTTTGTAPNRIHKIEAKQFVQYGNTTAEGSAQLWLYENGNIEVHYGSFNRDWTPGTTNGVQVGLRGNDITDVRSVGGTWSAPVAGTNAADVLPNTGANGEIPSTNQVLRFTLPTGDLTPPAIGNITVNPLGGSCTPQAHTVSVSPTDATGIATAQLIYFVAGTPTPTTVLMTRTGNTFSATIPAQGSNGVRFQIKVTDSSPNSLVSTSAFTAYRDAALTISAGPSQLTYAGLTDTLTASSSLGGAVRITEFTLYNQGTGATNPYPSWIPTSASDFVELTNMGNGPVDLSGFTFEAQGGATARTYTFPSGVILPGREVLVLHIGSGTDDPNNYYYNTDGPNDTMFSGNDQAFVLTSATGQVVDAVVVNAMPLTAPITSSDWTSGTGVSSPRNIAGAGLYGADTNSDAGWSDATAVPQSIGALNSGLPVIASTAGVQWTGPNLTGTVTANPLVTPVFTAPGRYVYTASVSNGSCTATDTVTVVVLAPTAPVVAFSASTTNPAVGDVVFLNDLSLNRPSTWQWTVTPSAGVNYFNPTQHGPNNRNPWLVFTAAGTYTVKLRVSNGAGADSLTRTGYITVGNPRYCQVTGADCSVSNIDGLVITGTNLRNRGTGCGSTSGYTSFPATDSTTATLRVAQAYTFRVKSTTTGSIAAWIDFNNNDVFDTTEYFVLVVRPNPTPGQYATAQVTIPDSAGAVYNQPVGMRIRSRRFGGMQNIDACTAFFDGETEDYIVDLLPPLPPTGVASAKVQALAVYPNPSNGTFRVNLSNTGAHRIELAVTDALGRVVHQQSASDNTLAELNLHTLSSGVYMLRISLDGEVGFRRIEIQK